MSDKPRLDPERVNAFVKAGHGDLEQVKELLAEQPELLHAAWDWGGGDWETALGAAAHMGNREIAKFLLEQGARMDIFAAAMLGQLEIVQNVIEVQPEAAESPGAHGIPLLVHAKQGGAEAREVVAYLEGLQA